MASEPNGCNGKRAVADIAAGAVVKLTDTRTKAKLAYIVCIGLVAGALYGMYVGGVKDNLAFVERCLFVLATAATTALSTYMGVNAALSGRANGKGEPVNGEGD